MKSFTDSQKRAIRHDSGLLRIIACPGSGKTETVSRRISALIKAGVNPSEILAFTFTEKAAKDLKFRIDNILHEDGNDAKNIADMWVGTTHHVAFELLKKINPKYRSFEILSENSQIAFVSRFYFKIGLKKLGGSKYRSINDFTRAVDKVRVESIDVSRNSNKDFVECLRKYDEIMEEQKLMDFSKILSRLKEELEVNSLSDYGINLSHLTFDEFQDANRIQYELMILLAKDAVSVACVGDDDQSIYNWRGSDLSFIRDLDVPGKKMTTINLDTNFRSTREIIETTTGFIEENQQRLDKAINANGSAKQKFEQGDLFFSEFDQGSDELEFIEQRINNLVGTKIFDGNDEKALSWKDFAVETRTNDHAAVVVNSLRQAGIPCLAYSGESMYMEKESKFVLECLLFLIEEDGIMDEEYQNEVRDFVLTKKVMKNKFRNVFGKTDADARIFLSALMGIKKDLNYVKSLGYECDNCGQHTIKYSASCSLCKGRKKNPKDYLNRRFETGLQKIIHRIIGSIQDGRCELTDVQHYVIAFLSKSVEEFEGIYKQLRYKELKDFKYFYLAALRHNYSENPRLEIDEPDAVKVMTMHKSKGLEFACVFMPFFYEKRNRPYRERFIDESLYDHDLYAGDDEAERRLYYVAMTRAKKYLCVSYSVDYNSTLRLQRPRQVHRLFDSLPMEHFSSDLSISRRKSSRGSIMSAGEVQESNFSDISVYNRCPADYKFRVVYGYNAGVPAAYGFGTNVHNILNSVHSHYLLNGKVPDKKQVAKMIEDIFHMRYAPGRMENAFKKKATLMLGEYMLNADLSKTVETEKKFEFSIDGVAISGSIDLLKKVDGNGVENEIELLDFKTKSDPYTVDAEEQVKLYSLASEKSLGFVPESAAVYNLNDNKKKAVDITPQSLGKFEKKIKRTIKMIEEEKFDATPDADKCSGCDWVDMCPYRSSSAS